MENDTDFDVNPNSKLQLELLKLISSMEDKLMEVRNLMVKVFVLAAENKEIEDRLGPIDAFSLELADFVDNLSVRGGVVYNLESDLEEEEDAELENYFRSRRTSTT